jgi:hypothetical protein
MNKSKPSPYALRQYLDFAEFIPHRISKRQVVNLATTGRFPSFVQAYPRAEPLWREGDIVEWIAANYGGVLPEYVTRLRIEGFSGEPFCHGERV